MSKTMIVISAALTAFTLLILSGVIYSVQNSRQAAAAEAQPVFTEAVPASPEGFAEREAAYQELIQQANQRLEQAQAEIERLQSENAQDPAQAQISLEAAAQIAAGHLGQTEIYSAEGVTLAGQPAYRITFSSGDVVLVSPSGEVVAVQQASQTSGFSASTGDQADDEDDDHDDEHDDDEHEEHEHEEYEHEG